MISPPDGYKTWLDYAVENMSTKSEFLERVANGNECSREDMRGEAKRELEELREKATDINCPNCGSTHGSFTCGNCDFSQVAIG